MNILFLSRWFPFPPNNGSKLRVYNLLRGIGSQNEVTLLAFVDEPVGDAQMLDLRQFCKEVKAVPWKSFNPGSRQAIFGFFDSTPRSVRDTFSPEMAKNIQQTLQHGQFDCIIASQIDSAAYYPYFQGIPAILDEVELGLPYERFSRARNIWQRFRTGLTWVKHSRYLGEVLRSFQACTVVSRHEKHLLSASIPHYKRVEIIPNCVNLMDYNCVVETYQPSRLIFTGSFRYLPNYQAMLWFLDKVYPLILAQVPDTHLVITGDPAGKELPQNENVSILGFVDDVRPLIAESAVSVAPLLQGGGTRLKILEAMALRTPVVATTKGAEGLELKHNEHLKIADAPDEFAEGVIQLLKDENLRHRLAEAAYELICEKYNWERVLPQFNRLIESVTRGSEITA